MMEIRFNASGTKRKELVNACGDALGIVPVYQKAPSFAYQVGTFVIDKNGALSCDEGTSIDIVKNLLERLADKGFVWEDSFDAGVFAEEVSAGDVPVGDDLDRLVIEVPMEGFTETALDNLEKLVAGKAALMMAAVGADALPIVQKPDRLCFPWFTPGASTEEVTTYTQLVALLCEAAKKQTRVTAQEKPVENEKYAMRCFLLKLGFIGKEYAVARKILLKNLSGDASFKSGRRGKTTAQTACSPDADNECVQCRNKRTRCRQCCCGGWCDGL